jgi:hypothetical protein
MLKLNLAWNYISVPAQAHQLVSPSIASPPNGNSVLQAKIGNSNNQYNQIATHVTTNITRRQIQIADPSHHRT